jgi:hypothetical protein
MMWIIGKTQQIPKVVLGKKVFGGIIGLDTGSVVLIVFDLHIHKLF